MIRSVNCNEYFYPPADDLRQRAHDLIGSTSRTDLLQRERLFFSSKIYLNARTQKHFMTIPFNVNVNSGFGC